MSHRNLQYRGQARAPPRCSEHFSSLVMDELLIAYDDAAAPSMSRSEYIIYQEHVHGVDHLLWR